jgi:hypothetical protein
VQPAVKYEDVTVHKSTGGQSYAYFLYEKDGKRHIEVSADRQEKDMRMQIASDGAKSFFTNIGAAAGGATFTLVELDPDVYGEGVYNLLADSAVFVDAPDEGGVGTNYIVFNPDGGSIWFQVIAFGDANVVRVDLNRLY